MRDWARSLDASAVVRAAEGEPSADFAGVWSAAVEMGIPTIGLAEESGGGGGSALDVAVVLEALAHELVPGGFLSAAVAARVGGDALADILGSGGRVALALDPALSLIGDG